MRSEPSSPRRDTEFAFGNRVRNADDEDLLNCVTTFTYTVTRGVLTVVNANDLAVANPNDGQGSIRRRGRKRARS